MVPGKKMYSGLCTENVYDFSGSVGDCFFKVSDLEPHSIPSTGEIGRSIVAKDESFLSLINPRYDVKSESLIEPLVVEMYKKLGSLKILNVACGGCADIPFLQQKIEETISYYDISNPSVEIVNVDNSDIVKNSLKRNNHPYYVTRTPIKHRLTEQAQELLDEYLFSYFSFDSTVDEVNFGSLELKRDKYNMYCSANNSLNFLKADLFDLPFKDDCFDLVIALNIFSHLANADHSMIAAGAKELEKDGYKITSFKELTPMYDYNNVVNSETIDIEIFSKGLVSKTICDDVLDLKQVQAKHELTRVLKNGGYLFPSKAIYRRNNFVLSEDEGSFLSKLFGPKKDMAIGNGYNNLELATGYMTLRSISTHAGGWLPTESDDGEFKPYCMSKFDKRVGEFGEFNDMNNLFLSNTYKL